MKRTSKIIEYAQLGEIRQNYPDQTIVHCHGVFDLFHYGHLLHLQEAKKQGDILVVSITPDKYVNKGPHRPHHNEQKRLELLSHLEIIDHVALNESHTGVEAITLLKPDLYVKGPDYKDEVVDETHNIVREREAVESVHGKLICTTGQTDSSTRILNRHFSMWDKAQQAAIDQLKTKSSVADVLEAIEKGAELKVLVVGEPIIDRYVFCNPVGISSKSSTVAAQFLEQEDYAGGSLAIANHLAALGCETTLLLPSAQEPFFKTLLKTEMMPTVKIAHYFTKNIPTPIKTRFLTKHRAQRMFELIDVRANDWESLSSNHFCAQLLELSSTHDMVIVADFGHGLFEKSVLKCLGKIDKFLALNVQTNSGNFGFNPFTKHQHFDYLCMDVPELRLATHDRLTPISALADRVMQLDIQKNASLTLGSEGSIYYQTIKEKIICPAFFNRVLDTTGAGDAYFAITALLTKMNVTPTMIPFIGNCFAGIHTQTMGNKYPVNKVDLVRVIRSILE